MSPSLASLICCCGIAGLLYLDREKTSRTSWALWIPGLWIGIAGSRPASSWLGLSPSTNARMDGSPFDAAVFAILLIAAIVVLVGRSRRVQTLLLANRPILIYFAFCLVSLAWSYHPDIALKRWIKAIGDLAMVLVIATDLHPVVAIRRVVSRIGMVLLPVSVLFIQYYGDLGRGYTSDGLRMNTGVTDNKNSLGLIVLVISLVVLWNVRWLFLHKNEPNRNRRLLAQSILLGFGLQLFWMANSSTSKACFFLGALLIFALNLSWFKGRPGRVHALCLTLILLAGLTLLLGGQGQVAGALGRESNFSGRTEIWAAVIPAAQNSIVGAGFESFWISPNVKIFQQTLLDTGWYPPLALDLNEAHNGYLEMYMNLGLIGVGLLMLILLGGYRRATQAFRRNPELGSLFIAFIVSSIAYGITEASFRMMMVSWIFLILAVVGASGVTTGLFGNEVVDNRVARNRATSKESVSPLFQNGEMECSAPHAFNI